MSGVPEALRLANYLDGMANELALTHYTADMDAAAAELRRLHAENERLATLVEAQQSATSAAAFDEHGFRDWVLRNLPKGSIIGNGEWWADHLTAWAKRFVKVAPQPSTTPQADSQPAPVSSDTLYLLRRLLSNQHTLTGSEFRAELEKIVGEAAQTTDSVTAPATEGYVQPVPDKCDRIVWRGRYYHLPLTPPAQTADSAQEDAARYRWLRRWKGQEHEPPFTVQHEVDGALWGGDLDAAIDAAMNKGGA